MSKLTKKIVENFTCPAGKNLAYSWDSTLPGFGVRCTEGGVKAYVVRYRIAGKQRLKTIARVSVMDISAARDKARAMINDSMLGEDPFGSYQYEIKTVQDLSEAFQEGKAEVLKPKTLASYESLWAHINKVIGRCSIENINEFEIIRLRKHLGKRHTTFNRCVSLLISAMKWQGLISDNHPLRSIRKYKEKTKQRILSSQENLNLYKLLNQYKLEKKSGWRYADLFILLILTGLRRDEWRCGRWEWVRWTESIYDLPDNKTGGRRVYLSDIALTFLKEKWENASRPRKGFIFPARKLNCRGPMAWTWRLWDKMRKEIGLDSFRIHDLRHTAGSIAHSSAKLTQRQVADFLGHSRIETSARYIHDNQKKESANAAAKAIADSWCES